MSISRLPFSLDKPGPLLTLSEETAEGATHQQKHRYEDLMCWPCLDVERVQESRGLWLSEHPAVPPPASHLPFTHSIRSSHTVLFLVPGHANLSYIRVLPANPSGLLLLQLLARPASSQSFIPSTRSY